MGVQHDCPAAEICPEEAKAIVGQQEAGLIEQLAQQNLEREAPGVVHSKTQMLPEKVYLLRYGAGDVNMYREKLLQCPQLSGIRENVQQAGYTCELPEKALLFVKPEQYEATKHALLREKIHPFHIIATESVEY